MRILFTLVILSLCACGSSKPTVKESPKNVRSKAMVGGHGDAEVAARCDSTKADREESAYDTSGDENPDVRKVYLQVGEGANMRLVLICRESDLNGDGVKDVVEP